MTARTRRPVGRRFHGDGRASAARRNRIDAKFADLKSRRETALIPFIPAGDPDLPTTLEILQAAERNGADLIELGVPFSDPMADGPTIQRASERALQQGTTIPRILALVREFRRTSDIPVILFGYYNPFFHYGVQRLSKAAKKAGVDGVLCVDLPPEESLELKQWMDKEDLALIFLLAPTSDLQRIRLVAREGRGFVYYVSVTGVTGARKRMEQDLPAQISRLRRHTTLPVGVGFGISTAQQAARVASLADAVVVGSALIDIMEKAGSREEKRDQVGAFIHTLKRAIQGTSTK